MAGPRRNPPELAEETTDVTLVSLRGEIRHVASTQEGDVRQLHGRISKVATDVTELKVSNATQTAILTRIELRDQEDRAEERERRRLALESDHAIRVETSRIPRLAMTNRVKITLAVIALLGTGIGAGVKLISIYHG